MSELNVRFGGSATSKFIGEDYLDFEALESAGNVTFDEAARARFADAADRYMTNLAIEESDPGSREVQNKLKAMERHARELAKLLGDRRPQAVQAAQQEAFPFEQVDHKKFLSALSKIKVRAAKAHDHLTQAGNSGGRPRQLARHTLLVNIYELWKEAGGQGVGVYKGNDDTADGGFYKLSEALFAQLDICPRGLRRACEDAATEYQSNSP